MSCCKSPLRATQAGSGGNDARSRLVPWLLPQSGEPARILFRDPVDKDRIANLCDRLQLGEIAERILPRGVGRPPLLVPQTRGTVIDTPRQTPYQRRTHGVEA